MASMLIAQAIITACEAAPSLTVAEIERAIAPQLDASSVPPALRRAGIEQAIAWLLARGALAEAGFKLAQPAAKELT